MSRPSSVLRALRSPILARCPSVAVARTYTPSLIRPSTRTFTSSPVRSNAAPGAGSSADIRNRQAVGVFTWKTAAIFVLTGIGLTLYFRREKRLAELAKHEAANRAIGRPKVGGPFELVDHTGKTVTSEDFKGKYMLVYFGFTRCPDICPEELDKLSEVLEKLHGKYDPANPHPVVTPLFVTCDPARDTPAALSAYLPEFHPSIIGLTGTYDKIKAMCKAYRVYFSTPPVIKEGEDYLVDHSIFFYLMDPEGQFVDAFGKHYSVDEMAGKIREYVGEWDRLGRKRFRD